MKSEKKAPEIRYYDSFSDDFVESKNQNKKLPKNYRWIKKNPLYSLLSYLVYWFALATAFVYVKLVKRIKIQKAFDEGANKRSAKENGKEDSKVDGKKWDNNLETSNMGRIFYANHTMEIGDVLTPFIYCFPHRPYIICSPANLGVPVVGKLLPLAGGMPIPDNLHDLVRFNKAVEARLKQDKTLIIYPEAHLWPFCTFIRPFNSASFHYPATVESQVLTATTIYDEKKIEIALSGPFVAEGDSKKERQSEIEEWVRKTMESGTKKSKYSAIIYKKRDA